MNSKLGHYLISAAIALLFLSSCSSGPRVIPRKTMAKIYAEMFVTDEWIRDNSYRLGRLADTSLVYEPLLEEFGYDSDDYLLSVEEYLNDPERFSRILRDTEAQLNKRLAALKLEKSRLEALAKLQRKRDSIREFWSISVDSMNTALIFKMPQKDSAVFSLLLDSLLLESLRADSLAMLPLPGDSLNLSAADSLVLDAQVIDSLSSVANSVKSSIIPE